MKNPAPILILSLLLCFSTNLKSSASNAKKDGALTSGEIKKLLDYDDAEVYAAFDGLSELEQYLNVHNNYSFSDVSIANGLLLSGVCSGSEPPGSKYKRINNGMGIPPLVWGCALGVFGILIVNRTTLCKGKKSMVYVGCAANAITIGIIAAVALTSK